MLGKGEAQESEEAMKPLGKAGLQDPVGYSTNPPPEGRAVRVYADGVFDLFHLGYVFRIRSTTFSHCGQSKI